MVKKVIGYTLLCCLLNVLTTLPAKCCESGAPIHRHTGKAPAHSHTLLQYLLDIMGDESSPDDPGVDVHCSVYNETRPLSVESTPIAYESGNIAIRALVVTAPRHATNNARQFPVPQHHNFLFRLTPF